MFSISVVSFNILADTFVRSAHYPKMAEKELLIDRRREKILSTLLKLAETTDIFCIQELTELEFTFLKKSLSHMYHMYIALDDKMYRYRLMRREIGTIQVQKSDLSTGTCSGTGIFIKKQTFGFDRKNILFNDIPLSGSGNHCASIQCTHKPTDKKIRIFSLHLDSQNEENRSNEMNSLLAKIPESASYVDVIGGDFNVEVKNCNLGDLLKLNNFMDTFGSLNVATRTHPFNSCYYESQDIDIVDHIYVRRGIPVKSMCIDKNLEVLYPSKNSTHCVNEDTRIIKNLKFCGSDHYPIKSDIMIMG